MNSYFVKEQRRSQRFQLALPMALVQGSQGEARRAGETRNVSSTGVYFVVNDRMEPGALLQFIITLPEEISMVGPVRLLCKGKVMRVEPHEGALLGVAATIERYEFLRDTVS